MSAPKTALVMVDGDDRHHDLIAIADVFQQIALDAGFLAHKRLGLGNFENPEPAIVDADVYVLFVVAPHFSEVAQQSLADLVSAGKGVVAIHASNFLPDDFRGPLSRYDVYYRMLGCRWVRNDEGDRIGPLSIRVSPDHPIAAGIEDFDLVDERDLFELHDDEIDVVLSRTHASGKEIPVMYTRNVGDGRVVFNTLGHGMRTWGDPNYRSLMTASLRWAAGEE